MVYGHPLPKGPRDLFFEKIDRLVPELFDQPPVNLQNTWGIPYPRIVSDDLAEVIEEASYAATAAADYDFVALRSRMHLLGYPGTQNDPNNTQRIFGLASAFVQFGNVAGRWVFDSIPKTETLIDPVDRTLAMLMARYDKSFSPIEVIVHGTDGSEVVSIHTLASEDQEAIASYTASRRPKDYYAVSMLVLAEAMRHAIERGRLTVAQEFSLYSDAVSWDPLEAAETIGTIVGRAVKDSANILQHYNQYGYFGGLNANTVDVGTDFVSMLVSPDYLDESCRYASNLIKFFKD